MLHKTHVCSIQTPDPRLSEGYFFEHPKNPKSQCQAHTIYLSKSWRWALVVRWCKDVRDQVLFSLGFGSILPFVVETAGFLTPFPFVMKLLFQYWTIQTYKKKIFDIFPTKWTLELRVR